MRRKLIKQGQGALTISLPKKWTDFNELHAGDDLILEEDMNNLVLKTNNQKKILEAEISLSLHSPAAYRSIIGGLYRGGYDVIKVNFSDKKVIPNLEKAVSTLYGFEVFYSDKEGCIIRSIYDSENTDVEAHVRRMIFAIKTMQSIITRDISKGISVSDEELLQLRNNILKQRDLIVRIIKKQKLLSNDIFPYYTISLSLWGIARNYFHLYKDTEGKQNTKLLEHTNKYFEDSFKKIASLSGKDFLIRNERYAEIYDKCKKALLKDKTASYCMAIVLQIQLSDSSIYLLNYRQ